MLYIFLNTIIFFHLTSLLDRKFNRKWKNKTTHIGLGKDFKGLVGNLETKLDAELEADLEAKLEADLEEEIEAELEAELKHN